MSPILARVAALLITCSPAIVMAAGASTDKSALTGQLPATPEAWAERMLYSGRNGAAVKDPAAFAEWLDAVTEPRFMTALASVAADPATYPKALSSAIDPAAARNWSEFTDPQLYLRWMLASANPSFQQAIIHRMTDPGKMKRWVEAVSRPEPQVQTLVALGRAPAAWMRAPLATDYYTPLARMSQPATPMAWFGAMAGGVGQRFTGGEWLKLPPEKYSGGAAGAGTLYRY